VEQNLETEETKIGLGDVVTIAETKEVIVRAKEEMIAKTIAEMKEVIVRAKEEMIAEIDVKTLDMHVILEKIIWTRREI